MIFRAKAGLGRVAKNAARAQRTDAQKAAACAKREANMQRQEDMKRQLLAQLKQLGVTEPPLEERAFAATRKWKVDMIWPQYGVAVEIEGIGRHQTLGGFLKDCEKYNELAARGVLLIRTTHHYITDWKAAQWITRAIRAKKRLECRP